MKTEIKFFGQAAFEITVGEQNLLIDPWFNGNPFSPVEAKDFNKVDLIAVTHGHMDHFGQTMEIMRNTQAKIIGTTILSWYMELRGFTRKDQRNLSLGQGGTISEGNMRISMVNALHPTALFAEEWTQLKQYHLDGGAVGYVVRTPDNIAIYHAGDTDIFMDMQLIERRYHPDIAILPIGGRFTMDWEAAVIACEMLKPKVVIPMHYNTNPHIQCDVNLFVERMQQELPDIKVVVLNPGDTYCANEG
jgi:L-ascorbate metabolism protein UlaG (beta-lactamase superfamily)